MGKASSNHLLPQDDINRLIADIALEGKIVTRLKGGDPYVFGRGGEEAELLRDENIDFEVVPGITSPIGGLCYAGIPITHRDHASSFHVITGHPRKDGKETKEINWNALANVKGTLVFLMGIANLKNISENLIKEGKDKNTPVAFISWATRVNQRVVTATLENAYEVAIKENIKPPTLIVVGTVVNLREKLNFFEEKPLFGKNIVVTRCRAQSSALAEKISDMGGNPIEIPTIKIEKVENNIELENEIKNIKDYSYIIFSSKNAVDIFFDKLNDMGYDARLLYKSKICVVGVETAKAIKARGIIADIIPQKYVAEGIYDELKDIINENDKILIPRAKNARDFLVSKLSEKCYVKEVITYESVIDNNKKNLALEVIEDESVDYITFASSSTVKNFITLILSEKCYVKEVITYESVIDNNKKNLALEVIEDESVDYITFASSSTVKNFITLIGKENLKKLENKKIISIGPITSKTIEDFGLGVYKEAEVATIDSTIEAISNDNNVLNKGELKC